MKIETFLDLCSGIGGGRLGLEQVGLSCIGYSDTSRLAVRTYQLMFDTSKEIKFGNLKKINSSKVPPYDVLIAGFPCQTFSVIGRKDGFSDDRGQIIFHIARILKETRPKCFILENVRGLVTHDKGNTLKIILEELNSVGYNVVYKVLTSIEHGVPQMRQRVYFIGVRKDISNNLDDFKWPEPEPKPGLDNYLIDMVPATEERLEILGYYLNNPTNNGEYSVDDLKKMEGKILDTRMSDLRIYDGKVPTLRAQRDGILYVKNGVIYQLTGYEALLLQGFPKEYADKVKNEVSDRHLLMQAGNAMTVNVIKKLGKAIVDFFNRKDDNKMPKGWKEFEKQCCEYLNDNFGSSASFTEIGGEDSTQSDILVKTKSGEDFFIEVKEGVAQCGQFVLTPNIKNKEFEFSEKNKTKINQYVKTIIEYMNENFETFKNAGRTGVDLIFENDKQVFADWIVNMYKGKRVRYIITSGYKIFHLDDLLNAFDISAKYRVKRSGSNNVGRSYFNEVEEYIHNSTYEINNTRTINSKLFVSSNQDLDKIRFYCGDYEYMFSKREDEYEVRKLSNTFNANVIFSLSLKSEAKGIEDDDFISALS